MDNCKAFKYIMRIQKDLNFDVNPSFISKSVFLKQITCHLHFDIAKLHVLKYEVLGGIRLRFVILCHATPFLRF